MLNRKQSWLTPAPKPYNLYYAQVSIMDSHYLFPYLSHIPYNYYLMYPCYIVYHTLCISKLNASILSRIPAVECSALATLDWSGLCCLQLGHELLHRRGWEVQHEVNDTRCVRLKLRGDDNLSDKFMRFISKTKRKNTLFISFLRKCICGIPSF